MKIFSALSSVSPRIFISLTIGLSLFFLCLVSLSLFQLSFYQRLYPRISVAGVSVGGLSLTEAQAQLAKKEQIFENGLVVTYKDTTITIGQQNNLSGPDTEPLVIVDKPASVLRAYRLGRGKNFLNNISEQIKAVVTGYSLPAIVSADRLKIIDVLRANFSNYETTATNAQIIIKSAGDIEIVDGQSGLNFNYEEIVSTIINQFEQGNSAEIYLTANTTLPEVQTARPADIENQIEPWLNLPPLTLTYDNKKWLVSRAEMQTWLGLKKSDGLIVIGFDEQKIKTFLESEVAPKLVVEAEPPRLEITDGRVTVWRSGQDGIALEADNTIDRIITWSKQASEETDNSVEIAVTKTVNTAVDQSAVELGIKEIIGYGTSHFAGSPKNRRHNINVGAQALHGLLIKPGEEFSLLKALGEIDGAHGYLPELVIKDNKTTPEYGGGLCQIGTTVFRATFNSGLPVTQRRNHSYRVVYYEPAGTDATIYDPAPDYRFMNDTEHYILIQAKIVGDDLTFEFWGTKDGRQAEATAPVIYNIVKPAPTKIIETTDLPEGEKRCTESAHAGADAYFDYKVTYPNGEVKEKRFSSHYIPWQAVCLVGAKEKTPEPEAPPTPTSTITPTITPDN